MTAENSEGWPWEEEAGGGSPAGNSGARVDDRAHPCCRTDPDHTSALATSIGLDQIVAEVDHIRIVGGEVAASDLRTKANTNKENFIIVAMIFIKKNFHRDLIDLIKFIMLAHFFGPLDC